MSNARETSVQYISSTQNTSTFKDASLPTSLKPKSQENGNGFTSDDTEISIFDAHKYFNETKDIGGMSSVDGYCRNLWTKSFRSTPTPSSEISCNSQTDLLPDPQHFEVPINCINKRWYAVKKWLFTTKCCCRGKKSVQVKESTSDLNPVVKLMKERENTVEIHHIKAITDYDGPRQRRISASVGFTFPVLNTAKQGINPLQDSDVESDASSDLFEIDTQTTSCPVYRRRNSADHDHGEVSVGVKSAAKLPISAAALKPPEMGGEKAVSMKCVAEGPPSHVGGRPSPPQSFGRSHSAGRLSEAFGACEIGVSSQASLW